MAQRYRTPWDCSTREAIAEGVAKLGKLLEPESVLWVIVLGHAHFDGRHSFLNLPGPDVREDEFGDWFRPLRSREQVFFITTPVSGFFVKGLSARQRIVITATEADLEVNETLFQLELAEVLGNPPDRRRFDFDGDGAVTVFDLYLTVVRRVVARYLADKNIPTEHAQLDDNGDGSGRDVQVDYLTPELGGRARPGVRPPIPSPADGALARTVDLGLRPAEEKTPAGERERPAEAATPAERKDLPDVVQPVGTRAPLEPIMMLMTGKPLCESGPSEVITEP